MTIALQPALGGLRPGTDSRLLQRAESERRAVWPVLTAALIHLLFFLPWPEPAPAERAAGEQPVSVDVDLVDDRQRGDKKDQPARPPQEVKEARPLETPPPPAATEKGDQPVQDQIPAASDRPADRDQSPPEKPSPQSLAESAPEPPSPVPPAPSSPAPLSLPESAEGTVPAPRPAPQLPKPPPPKAEPPAQQPRQLAQPPAERRPVQPENRPAPPQPAPTWQPQIQTVPAPQPLKEAPSHSLQQNLPSIGYVKQVTAALNRVKSYPEKARAAGQQGVVIVRFTIARSGAVGQVNVVRSSGSEALDEAGLALVRRAAPYPPLPEDFSGNVMTLTLPLSFGLR